MESGDIMVSWQAFFGELGAGLIIVRDTLSGMFLEPWGQIQLLIALSLFAAAHLLNRLLQPRFEDWIRSQDMTRQRLKVLAILLRRLRLVFFTSGIWIALLVMRTITWPSRSYLLGVFASIATVWLAISLISRLVRNPLASRMLTVSVVAWASVQALGLMPTTMAILDAAAISMGEFRLSLLTLVWVGIVLAVMLPLAHLVSNFLDARIQAVEDISPSMRVLMGKVLRVTLFVVVSIVGLQSIGLDLTTLTVFSGAVGLGLGFGLQKVVSNLISGVILLLDRSVKPGDVIEVGDTFGAINKLGSRFVSVVTRDGREYLIPNEDLITNQVVNWSYSNTRVRLEVTFGVSYDADPLEVRALAIEAAKQPKRVLAVPAPVCHLTEYGESSVNYVLRFWVTDPSQGVVNIRSDVLIALWYALKDAGVGIPYPHTDIHVTHPITVEMAPPPRPARRSTKPKD